jgi:VanZ family protein
MIMKRKYFRWFLVIAWMTVIFMFSSQSGESSNENNRFVVYIFNLLGLDLDKVLGGLSNFIIRKAAHFTEYFILYLLLYRALMEDYNKRKALLVSLLGTFLYACSDEIHQAFVPERGPSFRDVLVDTSGGLLSMVLIYLFYKEDRGERRE